MKASFTTTHFLLRTDSEFENSRSCCVDVFRQQHEGNTKGKYPLV